MTASLRGKLLIFIAIVAVARVSFAQTIENTIWGMAAQVSKNLPMMVNAEVQATSVAASGKRIMYKYNVTKSKEQINTSRLRKEHYENSVNAMCSNPGVVNLLKQGAEIIYQFYDSRNSFLFEVSLTQRDCVAN
jgi:hypothetical protein